ncbi:protein obstructor-E-like [Dermatophagoides pteronyssinus]|uniref:Chitin-binding domain type 2 n=2 Tax=Dermatophagoides pteronyssinus TaxID=6956 RepID=A0ABQ8JV90_DERPT|nr:protein obstructor-E-like [Dermatophagoides pteronyssinus]KAH9426546.1 Chitin-binding domain type 2 [Dermatophagoides pteronyssinus]
MIESISNPSLFGLCFCLVFGAILSQISTPNELCKNGKFRLVEHEKYCDYYYRCDDDGHAVEEKCPNGLVFAGYRRGMIDNHCGYPYIVGCPDGVKVMGQSPSNSGNCPWSYGTFAHETSCTKYWQCWNGTGTLQQCPYSLLYNERIHSCDWPQNVPDCQKHPICNEKPNGAVTIENNCDRYWLCVGGYPRLQRCPAGLAFSIELSKCELDYLVPGCEPVQPLVDDNAVAYNNNGTSDANRDSRGSL